MTGASDSLALVAGMDIYLLDQLLRRRIDPDSRVLDAGCGRGRNLAYFLSRGFPCCGVDSDESMIAETRILVARLAPGLAPDRFRCAPVESTGFESAAFDLVISNAVLHFATDIEHFQRMIGEMWRVLAPGGQLFTRLATTIGIADRVRPRGGGWFDLPDGSSRFLVGEAEILQTTEKLGGTLADPIKTTLVQNLRSMTTWVLWKPRPQTDSRRHEETP